MLIRNKPNKFKKKVAAIALFFVVLAVFLIVFKSPVLAQGDANELLWGGTEGAVQNEIGLGNTDPRIIIARIIQVLLGFLGILAVLIIMYGGWVWMTSEGDPQKIDKAKQILRNGAIGLIIILMAFAIATFLINWLLGAIGRESRTSPPRGIGGGVGALGTCTIESVYPEPGQRDVPRNTSIIVTFRQDVDPNTIMDGTGNIIPENVRIYKEVDGDSCEEGDCARTNVVDVRAITMDNRTFVFIPNTWLGDGLHYFNYVVYLSNDIQKTEDFGGGGVFDTCRTDYFDWSFEVSDKVDLTPPQVKENGVFPNPDDDRDQVTTSEAVQATGSVTIENNNLIQPQVLASFTNPVSLGGSPALEIVGGSENTRFDQEGTITIAINPGAVSATIGIDGIGLGTANVQGNTIEFPNIFTVTLANPADEFSNGNSWTIEATSYVAPDTITIGRITIYFVTGAPEPGSYQVQLGGTAAQTASNVFNAPEHPDVTGYIDGTDPTIIHVVARIAGEAGNSINISSSNPSAISWVPMAGGQNGGQTTEQVGAPDEPRNAVIQVNFNEAMMPIRLSGNADDLQDYIAVKCLGMDDPSTDAEENIPCDDLLDPEYYFACGPGDSEICIHGTFEISNQYKTTEFVSNNQCGVNACGEPIYCLPENSHLRVDIVAAELESCDDAVCSSRPPFVNCSAALHCQDGSTPPVNYPLSDQATLPGAMDAALNSLDGNRDGDADGPVSYFNENDGNTTNGDNFRWLFYISDRIELDPPYIVSTVPANDPANASPISDLESPVSIEFNKLMMSSSLKSGGVVIDNGQTRTEHQRINIWNFGGLPLGYWITKENIDSSDPPDGYSDFTYGYINHTTFGENVSMRSQAGSGVKDIYQNCMKPAHGPACAGAYNSCCSGTASNEATCN